MESNADIYVRGFDGLSAMGQLGDLQADVAYGMIGQVAAESPDVARAMRDRYMDARRQTLVASAAYRAAAAQQERDTARVAMLARRTGAPEELVAKALAGDVDRAAVELRAQMYRM